MLDVRVEANAAGSLGKRDEVALLTDLEAVLVSRANELAKRMVQAGNFSKLMQMREHAFYADATAQLARSRQQAQQGAAPAAGER